MKTVELSLDDAVFDQVARKASERGLSIGDLLTQLIGDEVDHANGEDAFLGMLADEPALAEAICEQAMSARERDPLRV